MSDKAEGAGCGCYLLVLLFNFTIGGLCAQYSLWAFFAKDIPWYWDVVIGLFLGEFTVPLAIICWILQNVAGIPTPFIH